MSLKEVDKGMFLISLLINRLFIGHIIECCSVLHQLRFLCSLLNVHVMSEVKMSARVCVSGVKKEDTKQKFPEKVPKGGAISSHVVVKQN